MSKFSLELDFTTWCLPFALSIRKEFIIIGVLFLTITLKTKQNGK